MNVRVARVNCQSNRHWNTAPTHFKTTRKRTSSLTVIISRETIANYEAGSLTVSVAQCSSFSEGRISQFTWFTCSLFLPALPMVCLLLSTSNYPEITNVYSAFYSKFRLAIFVYFPPKILHRHLRKCYRPRYLSFSG